MQKSTMIGRKIRPGLSKIFVNNEFFIGQPPKFISPYGHGHLQDRTKSPLARMVVPNEHIGVLTN